MNMIIKNENRVCFGYGDIVVEIGNFNQSIYFRQLKSPVAVKDFVANDVEYAGVVEMKVSLTHINDVLQKLKQVTAEHPCFVVGFVTFDFSNFHPGSIDVIEKRFSIFQAMFSSSVSHLAEQMKKTNSKTNLTLIPGGDPNKNTSSLKGRTHLRLVK